jgi:hypothetical protein
MFLKSPSSGYDNENHADDKRVFSRNIHSTSEAIRPISNLIETMNNKSVHRQKKEIFDFKYCAFIIIYISINRFTHQ